MIVANVEAYKARTIDTEYGESVYIGLIMLFFLQIVLVGVPLFFIVQGNLVARFFLTTSMVFIMSMTVLLLIFVPKFLIYRKSLHEGEVGPNIRFSGVDTVNKRRNTLDDAEKLVQARKLYEQTWMQRIASLEAVLEEAGIDAKLYLRSANIIGDDNEILPIEDDCNSVFSSIRRKSKKKQTKSFESPRNSQETCSLKSADVSKSTTEKEGRALNL